MVFNWQPDFIPLHVWDWPVLPVADERARSIARDNDLKNGSTSLSAVYSELGEDFEGEALPRMATDYGVEIDEMRSILLQSNLGNLTVQRQGTIPEGTEDDEQSTESQAQESEGVAQ